MRPLSGRFILIINKEGFGIFPYLQEEERGAAFYGSPKDHLLPMATLWQADMLVLGNSAGNLLVKRVLGETALHIIRNADRPLFLCQ